MTAADEQLRRRLRSLFAEELQDGVQVLSSGLLALEAGAGAGAAARAEVVQTLFRAAHSLKGAAHAAGFPEAVAVCDGLETAFAAVRDGDVAAEAELVTRLLGQTDALARLSAELSDTPAPRPPALEPAAPVPPKRRAEATGVGDALGGGVTSHSAVTALRISAGKLDALFQQTGEGLAASQRLSTVAVHAVQAADQVEAARARLRSTDRTSTRAVVRDAEQLLDAAARAVAVLARSVEEAERVSQRTSSTLADAVQRLRTQPFAEACTGLERVVRDVAKAAGKHAHLQIDGGDIDVDRSVVAALRDPLLHLVRNAVDHGIEPPTVRREAGKPVSGSVEVVAELDGSLLTVTVRDDGGGIDTQRLREVAAGRGLPMTVDDDELPFLAGVSSRTDVTAVSGRGIGLDAARARLEQLGGAVEVRAHPSGGTAVTLTTPVTLALLRVLLAKAAGQVIAVPTTSVQRVERVERRALREVEGAVRVALGETSFRVVSLARATGLDEDGSSAGEQVVLMVPRSGDAVLFTDEVLDEVEVAVQPIPARLGGVPGLLGVAMLDSTCPALVLNPVALGRNRSSFAVATIPSPRRAGARILLAEDTVTTRALERSILEAAGYSVAVAVDGADAWRQLQSDGADLVVSDVDMPRMTGFELCRRIRSSTEHRELPVVLVTSLDTEADRQGGLAVGADAYVVKAEFQQGTLLDTIARLL